MIIWSRPPRISSVFWGAVQEPIEAILTRIRAWESPSIAQGDLPCECTYGSYGPGIALGGLVQSTISNVNPSDSCSGRHHSSLITQNNIVVEYSGWYPSCARWGGHGGKGPGGGPGGGHHPGDQCFFSVNSTFRFNPVHFSPPDAKKLHTRSKLWFFY